VVFAPGALNNAMEEISRSAANAGLPNKLVVGHSPGQARQIADGAPADIFISADPRWMDFLADRHLISEGSPIPLVSTHLVLVAPVDSKLHFSAGPGESLAAMLGDGKLAIADPDAVPAGRFAESVLRKQGSWPGLAGRLVLLQDVRSVLLMVERGEVPAGIGFSSDVANDQKVRVVTDFSQDLAPLIQFPLAVVAGHQREDVAKFVDFLLSPQGAGIFRKYGFSTN
jgi:molybdate transport system substrate-binding protein